MRFEWDENKRRINLSRHEMDFIDAIKVFDDETVTLVDDRFDYDEIRFITLGVLQGKVVSIVHTEHDDLIRFISFRRAVKHEEEFYFKKIRD